MKKLAATVAAALVAAPIAATNLPKPYKDGCSGGMSWFHRNVLGQVPRWESCCDTHDRAYARGGTSDQRLAADQALHACVLATEGWMTAGIMWAAVRPFGHPAFPTTWRWGFDRDYGTSWWYDRSAAE